jgi:hypothetical protein
MKDLIPETPVTDEFAPIELGSVSEETKGGPIQDFEVESGALNSRQ